MVDSMALGGGRVMVVALVSAVLLLALGWAAHGFIAQALVVLGVWLVKNLVLLGFLQTPTGRRTARAVRGGTYARLSGDGRRRARRAFRWMGRVEQGVLRLLGRGR